MMVCSKGLRKGFKRGHREIELLTVTCFFFSNKIIIEDGCRYICVKWTRIRQRSSRPNDTFPVYGLENFAVFVQGVVWK